MVVSHLISSNNIKRKEKKTKTGKVKTWNKKRWNVSGEKRLEERHLVLISPGGRQQAKNFT